MTDTFYFYDTFSYDTSKRFSEKSRTDFTVSVGIHICHNIGTHLGNRFYSREKTLQQNLFQGSKFCGTDIADCKRNVTGALTMTMHS